MSASYAQCCATNNPNDDGAHRGPGDAEHARDNAHHRVNMKFGATYDIVVELLGKRPAWRTDDAMSSSILPTAYCELECVEFYKRISIDYTDGDNIFH